MRIRDISLEDVIAGANWRLVDDASPDVIDWKVEPYSYMRPGEDVVYSALLAFQAGEVRPLLLIRDPTTYEWWGDMCEYVDGAWRELAGGAAEHQPSEAFVASPLPGDPSFMGEYSHSKQRDGFARWRHGLERIERGEPGQDL